MSGWFGGTRREVLTVLALATGAAATAQETEKTPSVRLHVHVDARSGDDAAGDGTPDKPFRTIGRALALQAKTPERATDIHLGLGHYGRLFPPPSTDPHEIDAAQKKKIDEERAKDREVVPIVLPPDVSLVGFGSAVCEIAGEEGKPLIVLPDRGECRLSGMTLLGAAAAVAAPAVAAGERLLVRAADLSIRGCADAFDFEPAQPPAADAAPAALALRADGLRVRGAKRSVHATGALRVDLDLDRCVFRDGSEGLSLDVRGAPATGAWQALTLTGCRFERMTVAAVRRFGSTALPADAPRWTISGCTFTGNQVGMALEARNGDQPLTLRDCEFLENELYGVSLVGSGDPLEGATTFERCLFRWNGIGVNLLSCGRPVELAECRVEDSTGNGIFAACFVGKRTHVSLARCVLACNGATGVFALTEVKEGLVLALDHCTVADNRGHGVERKTRKVGTGEVKLARCVVAGNAVDLVKVGPEDVTECLVGAGPFEEHGSAIGDPKFLRRSERDFRLAGDSPARRAEGPLGAPDEVASGGRPSGARDSK